MNILAIDIGNTNIGLGLFLNGNQEAMESVSGDDIPQLTKTLKDLWSRVPIIELSAEGRRDAVMVASSVKPAWTQQVQTILMKECDEKAMIIGKDVALPMPVWVDEPDKVGTDRVVSAAAAYAVAEHAVVVADIGTAMTIDLVDDNGVFQGGTILPGFELASAALQEHTAQLPKVAITRPEEPWGKNTQDAITCGIYYGAIGALQKIVELYAEKIGVWPQTIITGAGAKLIKPDCQFVDNHVPHLVLMGIVLAYQKHLEEMTEMG
ncbi:type III pantothenate kinase [Planctomycetota bacterium]